MRPIWVLALTALAIWGTVSTAFAQASSTSGVDPAVAAWNKEAEQHVVRHLNAAEAELAKAMHALGRKGTTGSKVVVLVKLDRNGHLLSRTLKKSSGHASLDRVALQVLANAGPFPALPAGIRSETMSVSVPINFANRPGVDHWRRAIVKRLIGTIAASRHPGKGGSMRLVFVLDSKGRLVSHAFQKSSGDPDVDEFVIDVVKSSSPFPPPPAALAGERHSFVLPIRVADRPLL